MPTISDLRRGARPERRRKSGAALLIVLAFVVLLTGLILAFFSRAVLEKQVSVGSANQVKNDGFMMGSIAATVSDLKQEIEAGSVVINPVGGNLYIRYYYPNGATLPTSLFSNMVPAITPGVSAAYGAGNTPGAGGFLNLVKVSLHSQRFYTLTSAFSGTPTDPIRASAVSTGISTDSTGVVASGSNDGTSLNGRYMSGTRWNLPRFAVLGSGTAFPLPDWIYVPRSPSGGVNNPTTFDPNMITAPNNMTTPTTVVGRYAYAIYDEGGLLDINVAGVPSPIAPSAGVTPTSNPYYSAYKNNVAMADLTQIGLTQAQIDTIVGWRNHASASQTVNMPTSTPPSGFANGGITWTGAAGFTSAIDYWANAANNPTGFLRPLSIGTFTTGLTQTDQFFTSRQQLIQFFSQVTGTASLPSLQYLTHFSRDLNQPSYIPAPTRAADLAISAGGNDKGGGTEGNIGLTASAAGTFASNTVNPSFLSARVTTAFVRNDNSAANVGDPLVKKRFALSRLAWLTFAGPIADDAGNLNPSTFPDGTAKPAAVQGQIGTIITQLETTFGYSPAFLAQGGPTNVKKYFGLVWVLDNSNTIGINDSTYKWKYEHGSKISGSGVAGNTTVPGVINSLGYVQADGRDPDFFELLKASIAVGSIAKAGTTITGTVTPGSSGTVLTPWGYQAQKDYSVDGAIMQIGANIIDQFDLDSYSTRILFDDGTGASTPDIQEFRGVEDLPYLYRVRGTHIKIGDSNPPETQIIQTGTMVSGTLTPSALTGTFTSSASTGTGTFMEIPEIFNPYNWDSTGSLTPGSAIKTSSLRPTTFKIVPLSADPSNINAGNLTIGGTTQPLAMSRNNGVAPPLQDTAGDLGEPGLFYLNGEAITFTIPATTTGLSFFREPTLLNKPDPLSTGTLAVNNPSGLSQFATDAGPPRGSQVTSTGSTTLIAYSNLPVASYYKAQAYTGTGTPNSITTGTLTDNQDYLGFRFGTVPLWIPKPAATTITNSTPMVMTSGVSFNGNTYITYQMQYLDPVGGTAYITYDEKFLPLSFAPPNGGGGGMNVYMNAFLSGPKNSVAYGTPLATNSSTQFFGYYATGYDLIQSDQYAVVLDPRTPRFSTKVYEAGQTSGAFRPPPFLGGTPQWGLWVDASQNALMSSRPDFNAGWDCINPPTTIGFYNQGGVTSVNPDGSLSYTQAGMTGLLSQNSKNGTYSANTGLCVLDNGSTGAPTAANTTEYYADPDGVVRRATAGYSGAPASPVTTGTNTAMLAYNGLPLQTSTLYTSGTATPLNYSSRPIMLNRPFASVADLGYTFSGTPWKNIDFSTPESGFTALLDVFCVNDTDDPNGLVAGKVNLNTRQAPVLKAILTGAYKDEFKSLTTGTTSSLSANDAGLLATATTYGLTSRTASSTSPYGPLSNLSELVGKWIVGKSTTAPVDGSTCYSGFSGDLNSIATTGTPSMQMVQRFHESTIRALANCGQTRVWNLMIDIVAQNGHFPPTAGQLTDFYVDGEQRYWVHLAIDRYTGQVIDQQIEVVKE